MSADKQSLYRRLPSVDAVLQSPDVKLLQEQWRRELVVGAVGDLIAELRARISDGSLNAGELDDAVARIGAGVRARIEVLTAPSFRRVINATGVIIHTNLGRSPLPQAALERVSALAGRYITLEYDLAGGERGQRDGGVRRLLGLLFPGKGACVVNNNAAAVLLALNTLAEGKEAVISRGRIIEIGDGFRINQIQAKSGARLVEVGTTNRTHLRDFEEAVGQDTALLLSVHPSNYRVIGFSADVSLRELVELGRSRSIPVIEDWGGGCIVDPSRYGLAGEQSAAEVLAAEPDAICFSGDKLLGGPQAGIIVGKPDVVEKMRRNHLYRALRADKMTLIALEETMRLYLLGEENGIPTVEMLGRGVAGLRKRAEAIQAEVGSAAVSVVESSARVGGGAAPEIDIPSIALRIIPENMTLDDLKDRLRSSNPPIIVRVQEDAVLADLRTVFPDEDEALISILKKSLS